MDRPRIVSLLPSATEIVGALGLRDCLVGRSHECDHPPEVTSLPSCTSTQVDAGGTSRAIHEQVAAAVGTPGPEEALNLYTVDAERIDRLAPDLVLTQSQCDVCAVDLVAVERAVAERVASRPRVVSLEPERLADIWGDVRRVADAAGVAERGSEVAEALRRETEEVAACTRGLPRPTVACLEWLDPIMGAGNWVPEMVERAGGVECFGTAGEHAQWLSAEALTAVDPTVLVAMPCGMGLTHARREMEAAARRSPWRELSAVRERRVAVVDGHRYFSRPGPRCLEAIEILREILHPGTFPARWRGSAWQWL